MSQSTKRIAGMLKAVNAIGITDDGQQRLAYTNKEDQAFLLAAKWCEYQGMSIRTDAAGNLIARRAGTEPDFPAVAIGSHLDTVYTGGQYDGTVGVVTAIEVINRLEEKNIKTRHPLEVIVFRAEESSRFGMATIGSKAMAGVLDTATLAELKDRSGTTFQEAVKKRGLDSARMNEAKRSNEELEAFLEVHIEQGLELEHAGCSIAIAKAVSAPTRMKVIVEGRYSHSGTTSMDKRKDALVASASIVMALESFAKEEAAHGTVGTVGVLNVMNAAMNVVPGYVTMEMDIRGVEEASIARVVKKIIDHAGAVEDDHGVTVTVETISAEKPVPLSETLQALLSEASERLELKPLFIPSGAGHDVMNMAKITESALVFIPSRDGLSHHPNEHSDIRDIVTACDVIEAAVKARATVVEEELKS